MPGSEKKFQLLDLVALARDRGHVTGRERLVAWPVANYLSNLSRQS